jgi:hypothetical protein
MAFTVSFLVNQSKIAQGPAFIYHNTLRANPGSRTLVDSAKPASIVDPAAAAVWTMTHPYTLGQTILDPNGYIQQVTVAGTSAGTIPTFSQSIGTLTVDGSVTWRNIGAAGNIPWTATTTVLQDQQFRDANNNIQQVLVPGATGGTIPTWATVIGQTTTDGGVTWVNLGPTISLSVTEGNATLNVANKLSPITADQATGAIDVVVNQDTAELDATFKELTFSIVGRTMPYAQYTTGTDTALPTGAQTYEQLTGGGLVTIPQAALTIIIPRRQFANPSKNVVATLHKTYSEPAAFDWGRAKVTEWKAKFIGLTIFNRLAGDQIWQWYEQT